MRPELRSSFLCSSAIRIPHLALCLGFIAAAWAETDKSALVQRVTFTVAPAQHGAPVPPPFGLPTTAVEAERLGPFAPLPGAFPDTADDDVYVMDETAFPPFTNVKMVDDGYPTVPMCGTGVLTPPPGLVPPPQATLPSDNRNMNALAMEVMITLPDIPAGDPLEQAAAVRDLFMLGNLHLQFSVDNAALGLPWTAVDWEAVLGEAPGDVFEAVLPPGRANVLLADEDSLGLWAIPESLNDDVDGMIVQDLLLDLMNPPPYYFIDTDGDGLSDTPYFYFSVDAGSIPFPSGTITSADVLIPGTGTPGPTPTPAIEPIIAIMFPSLGLQPLDDLDALFIDLTGTRVLFSLAAGSPSLNTIPNPFNPLAPSVGADPGDIIFVDTTIGTPFVVLFANELGIRGDFLPGAGPEDDELNALWVTLESLFDQFASLSIDTQPSSATVCPGDPVSFSVTASGTPPIHYQWFKDGIPIPGATTSSYSITSASLGDAGSYTCDVTNQINGTLTSNQAVLTVLTPVSIIAHPQSATRCPGDPVTFSVTANGSPTLSHQWRHDGTNIPLAVNSTYQIASVTPADAGSYDCVVTNPCNSVTSQAATLTVDGPLDVKIDPHHVVAQGLAYVVWDAVLVCAIPTIEVQWENLDTGYQYNLNEDPITINPIPSETTQYQVTVTDGLTREVQQRIATLLVAVDPIYFDYDGDDCNSLADLYLLADEWRDTRPLNDDPNGDGRIEIRDFLYINLDDPGGCPRRRIEAFRGE